VTCPRERCLYGRPNVNHTDTIKSRAVAGKPCDTGMNISIDMDLCIGELCVVVWPHLQTRKSCCYSGNRAMPQY